MTDLWKSHDPDNNYFEITAKKNYQLKHPDAEVTNNDSLPTVKDVYLTKQKGLLALVATMPLLVGLIASLILVLRPQDLRRQAAEPVTVLVQGVCIDHQVSLQVTIKPSDPLMVVEVKDLQSGSEVLETNFDPDQWYTLVVPTDQNKLDSGFVTISFVDKLQKSSLQVSKYEGVDCGSNN